MKNTAIFISLILLLGLAIIGLLSYHLFRDPCQGQCSIPPISDKTPEAPLSSSAFQVSTFKLSNGTLLYVLPTSFEPNETSVRILSSRGYADERSTARGSAELALEMAWESGINNKNSDEIFATLYEEGIELSSRVYPFYTVMDATFSSEKLDKFFSLAAIFVQKASVNSKGAEAIKHKIWKNLEEKERSRSVDIDDLLKEQLFPNDSRLQSLKLKDLQTVNAKDANEFLQKILSNPAEDIFIVVGDADPEKVYKELKNQLEQWKPPIVNTKSEFDFPTEETALIRGQFQKAFNLHQKGDGFTKLIFPLHVHVTPTSIKSIDFLANLIEERLRELLKEKIGSYQGIDVSYEFPLFPHLTPVVLSIQYRSPFEINQEIIELILKNLKELVVQGPTDEEYKMADEYLDQSEEYWRKNNEYWLGMLTNYSLWGWPVKDVIEDENKKVDKDSVRELILHHLDVNNYIVLTSHF